mmetsp:Transcript_47718/g.85853  ORF Transcript_47718/g.85853 Transcript_47718/m.85853 type:complete len:389 (-) Transcript_47718:99-1265(-)
MLGGRPFWLWRHNNLLWFRQLLLLKQKLLICKLLREQLLLFTLKRRHTFTRNPKQARRRRSAEHIDVGLQRLDRLLDNARAFSVWWRHSRDDPLADASRPAILVQTIDTLDTLSVVGVRVLAVVQVDFTVKILPKRHASNASLRRTVGNTAPNNTAPTTAGATALVIINSAEGSTANERRGLGHPAPLRRADDEILPRGLNMALVMFYQGDKLTEVEVAVAVFISDRNKGTDLLQFFAVQQALRVSRRDPAVAVVVEDPESRPQSYIADVDSHFPCNWNVGNWGQRTNHGCDETRSFECTEAVWIGTLKELLQVRHVRHVVAGLLQAEGQISRREETVPVVVQICEKLAQRLQGALLREVVCHSLQCHLLKPVPAGKAAEPLEQPWRN